VVREPAVNRQKWNVLYRRRQRTRDGQWPSGKFPFRIVRVSHRAPITEMMNKTRAARITVNYSWTFGDPSVYRQTAVIVSEPIDANDDESGNISCFNEWSKVQVASRAKNTRQIIESGGWSRFQKPHCVSRREKSRESRDFSNVRTSVTSGHFSLLADNLPRKDRYIARCVNISLRISMSI